MKRLSVIISIIVLAASTLTAQTDVYLQTQRTGMGKTPIFVDHFGPMKGEMRGDARSIRSILVKDLEYSGIFEVSGPEDADSSMTAVARVEATLGSSGEKLLLEAQLMDFSSNEVIFNKSYRFSRGALRAVAHRLNDEIIHFLVGSSGIAQTRILFCRKEGSYKSVFLVDYDGYGQRRLTRGELAVSPKWMDENRFTYTSYRHGNPDCYIADLAKGKKWVISARKGLNIAGSYFAPRDQLAVTMSMSGNSEIFLIKGSDGSIERRLTRNRAIDCSPSWSANGAELAFVSDRTGSPQIYVMDRFGGNVRRLTWGGNYNTSPAWSPDGEMIAYSSREGGLYRLKLISPDGLSEETVFEDYLSYEDPSWAPDSRHIAVTVRYGKKPWIVIVDIETGERRRLVQGESPSWSP
ncbi:MAG: hypothetical protein B6D63_03050 [Candidatus Latescibacteria bacterium 4484_7]|nr:MAG: hypothetical protein B6D63_03050 [Candidatus Latescibacteria bacterium 4484_7]